MKGILKLAIISWIMYVSIGIIWYWYEKLVYGKAYPNYRDSLIAVIFAAFLTLIIDSWLTRERRLKEEEK